MNKFVITLIGFCLWSVFSWAAEPALKEGVPERYVVREGDTLWGISEMYLDNPWLWPEIVAANPDIRNPDLIYPGDVITLVYVDGKPQLKLARGSGTSSATTSGSTANYQSDSGARMQSGRNVKLSPQIKVTEHKQAIPAIPLEIVNSFLARTRVVQPGELEAAPYVLAGSEKRILAGVGDDFYARGALTDEVDFYGIFRKEDPYIDGETGELLGIKALDIGSAQLKRTNGDVSTFLATRSEQEILPGDRLLSHEERRLEPVFHPQSPVGHITGKIIDVEGGVNQVGTLDVVAINRGTREELRLGDVLAIYKKGEMVRDRVAGGMVELPAERAGLMMVFRTFEKMSFALVLTASSPLAVEDEVKSP